MVSIYISIPTDLKVAISSESYHLNWKLNMLFDLPQMIDRICLVPFQRLCDFRDSASYAIKLFGFPNLAMMSMVTRWKPEVSVIFESTILRAIERSNRLLLSAALIVATN